MCSDLFILRLLALLDTRMTHSSLLGLQFGTESGQRHWKCVTLMLRHMYSQEFVEQGIVESPVISEEMYEGGGGGGGGGRERRKRRESRERGEGGREGGREITTYICTYEVGGANKKGESCICTVYFLPPTVFENHTNMSWNLCKKGHSGTMNAVLCPEVTLIRGYIPCTLCAFLKEPTCPEQNL